MAIVVCEWERPRAYSSVPQLSLLAATSQVSSNSGPPLYGSESLWPGTLHSPICLSVCPSIHAPSIHPSTHPFSASQQWCVPHVNCLGSQWVGECCKLPSPPWMVYLPVSCVYVFSQTFLAICRHPTPTFHVQESRGRKCKTWEMALT